MKILFRLIIQLSINNPWDQCFREFYMVALRLGLVYQKSNSYNIMATIHLRLIFDLATVIKYIFVAKK